MKKKVFIGVCFLVFLSMIICKYLFANEVCGFYTVFEWIIYLFIVPTIYSVYLLFGKPEKPFRIISAITLGIIISILLIKDWETGFIIQKSASTLLGSLVTYLMAKQLEEL